MININEYLKISLLSPYSKKRRRSKEEEIKCSSHKFLEKMWNVLKI